MLSSKGRLKVAEWDRSFTGSDVKRGEIGDSGSESLDGRCFTGCETSILGRSGSRISKLSCRFIEGSVEKLPSEAFSGGGLWTFGDPRDELLLVEAVVLWLASEWRKGRRPLVCWIDEDLAILGDDGSW
jgi:hypothetical protein